MATACASKRDLQMGEATFLESFHMEIHQSIYTLKEGEDFTISLQKINDRLVKTCERFVFIITPRVVSAATVEHIASSIATFIGRYSFLEREGIDLHHEGLLVGGGIEIGVILLEAVGHLLLLLFFFRIYGLALFCVQTNELLTEMLKIRIGLADAKSKFMLKIVQSKRNAIDKVGLFLPKTTIAIST